MSGTFSEIMERKRNEQYLNVPPSVPQENSNAIMGAGNSGGGSDNGGGGGSYDTKNEDMGADRYYNPVADYDNVSLPDRAKDTAFFIKDIFSGIWDWSVGAVQASQEEYRVRQAEVDNGIYDVMNDPAAMSSYSGGNTKDTPLLSPEEQQILEWANRADSQMMNGTIRPALKVGAGLSTIPLLLSGAGILGNASALLTAERLLGKAMIPFMVPDLAKSLNDHGLTDTTIGVAEGYIPVKSSIQMYNDPLWQKYREEHPGQAWTKLGLDFLDSLSPFAERIGRKGRKFYDNLEAKGKQAKFSLEDMAEKNKALEQKMMMDEQRMVEQAKAIQDKVASGKAKPIPKSKDQQTLDNVIKATEAEQAATPEVQQVTTPKVQYSVMDRGGRDVGVGETTITTPIKSNTVMETLNTILPTGTGNLLTKSKRVLGYFLPKEIAARLRDAFDFPTAAHELGHYLDDVLRINGFDDEIIDNFKKTWGEHSGYKKSEYRSEGIAEFTREYILNPEMAKKNFPGYFYEFTETLSKQPELSRKVELFGDQVRAYYGQGEAAKVGANLLFDSQKTSIASELKDALGKSKKDLLDFYAPIKTLTDNIQNKMGLILEGSANAYNRFIALQSLIPARVSCMLQHNCSPELFKVMKDIMGEDNIKNPVCLPDVFKEIDYAETMTKNQGWLAKIGAKNPYEALSIYYTARHSFDIAKEMAKRKMAEYTPALDKYTAQLDSIDKAIVNSIDKAEIKKLTAKRERVMAKVAEIDGHISNIKSNGGLVTEAEYKLPFSLEGAAEVVATAPKSFQKAAIKLTQFNENLLGMAKYYGLLDDASYKYLKETYPNYIPYKRAMERDYSLGMDKTVGSAGDISKIKNFYKTLSEEGSTRQIKDPLYEYSKVVNNIISKGETNLALQSLVKLSDKVQGMGQFFEEIRDNPELANPAKGEFTVWLDGKRHVYQAKDPILMTFINQSDSAKMRADFGVANVVATALRYGVTENPAFMLKNAWNDAFMSFVTSKGKGIVPLIPIVDTVIGCFKEKTDKQLKANYDFMGVPYSSRLGNIEAHRARVLENMGANFAESHGFKDGTTSALMNVMYTIYSKSAPVMKAGNELVENAPRIQEFDRMYKTYLNKGLSQAEALFRATEDARKVTEDFSQGGIWSKQHNSVDAFFNANVQGLRTAWNAFDNRKGVTAARVGILTAASCSLWMMNHNQQWYRETSQDIKNRYWLFSDGTNFYKFSKPHEFGVPCSVMERLLDYYYDGNVEAPKSLTPYLKGVFVPDILPTIFVPIIEVQQNNSFFTGKAVVPKRLQGVHNDEQFDNHTSYAARYLAKSAFGKAFDMSPMMIDHIIYGYTGSAGQMAMQGADQVLSGANTNRPAMNLTDLPIVSRFTFDPLRGSEPIDVFYKKLDEMQKDTNTYKKVNKLDKIKHPNAQKNMEKAQRELSAIFKDITDMDESTDFSPEEKRDNINVLRRKATDRATKALRENTDYKY